MRPLLVLALATAVALGGCSRDPAFADRTARVSWGSRIVTFTVDSCGLDGTTAFVVGHADSGATLQAVVGVEPDGETGVPRSTGITVLDFDTTNVSAFGEESWARRGEGGPPPGSIDEARVRGARIQASGVGVATDDLEQPIGEGGGEPIRLDARCDAEDE